MLPEPSHRTQFFYYLAVRVKQSKKDATVVVGFLLSGIEAQRHISGLPRLKNGGSWCEQKSARCETKDSGKPRSVSDYATSGQG